MKVVCDKYMNFYYWPLSLLVLLYINPFYSISEDDLVIITVVTEIDFTFSG